jgi:hypothetical protein
LLLSPACCAVKRRLLRGSVPYIDIAIGCFRSMARCSGLHIMAATQSPLVSGAAR